MVTIVAMVAASSQWRDENGVRQPAGEVHAWRPGQNQTLCGLPLRRAALRSYPHVSFEYAATDVLTEEDEVRRICPRCLAATGGRRDRRSRRRGTSPRP